MYLAFFLALEVDPGGLLSLRSVSGVSLCSRQTVWRCQPKSYFGDSFDMKHTISMASSVPCVPVGLVTSEYCAFTSSVIHSRRR